MDPARTPGAARQPSLDELRAFAGLAEALHFGRAARALGVSRPSLSEAIRRLEDKLQVVLFERTSRRVALTASGARLLPRARAVLGGVASLQAAAARRGAEPPTLRLGIEANGFAELTGPILDAFRALRPEAILVLREYPSTPQAFFDNLLDAALVRAPIVDERLEVHEMALEPRGILLAAHHPRAGSEDGSIDDFLDDRFVVVAPRRVAARDYWLAAEHRGGEDALVAAEAYSIQEVLTVVEHLGVVTTAGCSIARSYPLPGVAFAGVVDLAPLVLSVVTRTGDERDLVRDLVAVARRIVGRLAASTPDIRPLGPAAAPPRSGAPTVGTQAGGAAGARGEQRAVRRGVSPAPGRRGYPGTTAPE
jgi:DNA-binding transcriptional LysR family regulator